MQISKENYDELKSLLQEGPIRVTWDCGEDNTIVNFFDRSKMSGSLSEGLEGSMISVYDLPNATDGYTVTGNGEIILKGAEIVFNIDKQEDDRYDGGPLDFVTEELREALKGFKPHHACNIEFTGNVEIDNCWAWDQIDTGFSYTSDDFEWLTPFVEKDVEKAKLVIEPRLELLSNGESSVELEHTCVEIKFDEGPAPHIIAGFSAKSVLVSPISDIIGYV